MGFHDRHSCRLQTGEQTGRADREEIAVASLYQARDLWPMVHYRRWKPRIRLATVTKNDPEFIALPTVDAFETGEYVTESADADAGTNAKALRVPSQQDLTGPCRCQWTLQLTMTLDVASGDDTQGWMHRTQ